MNSDPRHVPHDTKIRRSRAIMPDKSWFLFRPFDWLRTAHPRSDFILLLARFFRRLLVKSNFAVGVGLASSAHIGRGEIEVRLRVRRLKLLGGFERRNRLRGLARRCQRAP